jgi:hypothetical protein
MELYTRSGWPYIAASSLDRMHWLIFTSASYICKDVKSKVKNINKKKHFDIWWFLWVFAPTLTAKLEDHSVCNTLVNAFLPVLHI